MSKKQKNLQPFLEYFKMLKTYVDNGFLEVNPDKHEAYITRAAWMTLVEPSSEKLAAQGIFGYIMYQATASEGLKDYDAAMRVDSGGPASDSPIWSTPEMKKRARAIVEKAKGVSWAIHIVAEEHPHDLLNTILLSRHRTWWKPFGTSERIDVINY